MKRRKMKMRNLSAAIVLLLLPATVVAGNPAKGKYESKGKYDWIYGEDNPYGDKKARREAEKEIKKEEKERGRPLDPSVDAWRDNDDIAKTAVYYGHYYMKEYVKVLDASIAYLKQVLCDEKGDARFANEQSNKLMELSLKMSDAVFGDKNLSRKDAARVIKKMADDYETREKENYRLLLIDTIEKRGIFKVKQGIFSEPEKPVPEKIVAREKPRDSGKVATSIDAFDPEQLDIVKLMGPDPKEDEATAKQLSKLFGPDPKSEKTKAKHLSKDPRSNISGVGHY